MSRMKQKRWIPIYGLGIAVTATIAAAAMTGSCVFDTRTNFCEQFGIRCKEGQECAAHQPVCIDIGGCGNGVVDRDKGEMCDDGNIVDGEMVDGKFVLDDCNHDCTSDQRCGNSIMDVGETCDHGSRNGQPDDSCDDHCQLRDEFCGNGIVDMNMGEQCDPGETDSVGCNSKQANDPAHLFDPSHPVGCKFSICGDGYTNTAINPLTMEPVEQCDSGDMPTRECNGPPLCTKPVCGDNFHNAEAEEDCDNGGADTPGCNGNNHGQPGPASCKFPACGDGYVNMAFKPPGSKLTETCDTGGDSQTCNGGGNGDDSNDPNAECQSPGCGDGYINTKFKPQGANAPETCDNKGGGDTSECNGNNHGNDGPGSCRKAACGDGYLNTKFQPTGSSLTETCDTGGDSQSCNGDGNGDVTNDRDAACQPAKCGDGYVNKMFMPGNGATAMENCDNKGGGNTSKCNGNNHGNDGPGSCRTPSCGDGYVNDQFTPPGAPGPEQCDKGAANSDTVPDACRANCQNHFCGDGVIDSNEDCDPKAVPTGCGTLGTCVSTGNKACTCS